MWMVRYQMVLRAYPSNDPTVIVPRMIDLLDGLIGRGVEWRQETSTDDSRGIPTSAEGWPAVVKELRDSDGSVGISLNSPEYLTMSLTVDDPLTVRTFDVMTLGFEPKHLSGPEALLSFESLQTLFAESVRLFGPFSAELGDREIVRKDPAGELYLSVDVTKVPTIIHWINYFDCKMVERLGGLDRLLRAPVYSVKTMDDPPGVVLVLQDRPFDYRNAQDRRRWQDVTQYLELERLQALYPRRGKR